MGSEKHIITIKQMVPVDLELELDYKDIYNWLSNCDNPATLRNLGNLAYSFARLIDEDNTKEELQYAQTVCSE